MSRLGSFARMLGKARIGIAFVFVAMAYGAWFLFGAQPSHHTSWPRYLVMGLLSGVIMLAAELVGDFVARHDRATDPIPRRLMRLGGLLASGIVFMGVLWLIARQM